jgi:hypothetical protein
VAAPDWVWVSSWEEHLVDEVDGGVGGLDVAAHHTEGAVDLKILAGDLEGAALGVSWLPTSWSGARWPWTTW